MICYLRASTLKYDVRLQKYVQACIDEDIPYMVASWNRLNDSESQPNEIQFRRQTPYGRRWRNLWAHLTWQCFLIKTLLIKRKSYDVIHACNIETVLPALFMKLFGKKVIFDIYDSYIIKLERSIAKKVDLLILPNNKRFAQIGLEEKQIKDFLEIENVPTIGQTPKESHAFNGCPIKLSYVGVFEKDVRGLEELVDEVLVNENLKLTIAGTGAGLESMITKASKQTDRINYLGVVDYSKALEIMSNSDFIVAQYYLSNPLHKYASPNKYYEALCLGTPLITTQGTLVGNTTEEHNVGYTVGENHGDLHKFFAATQTNYFREDYAQKKTNCINLWKKHYADYYHIQLRQNYINKIHQLCCN